MQRYSALAAFFHWLSAILVLALLYTGYMFHQFYEKGTPERAEQFLWHKSLGILLLLVALLRVATRFMAPPPALPAGLPAPEKLLARTSHTLLYFFILFIPLTGLIKISPDGGMTDLVFGVQFPLIPGVSEGLSDISGTIHEYIVWLFAVLLVVHVLAALYHHGRRTAAAGRMWPAR
ncbi:cytochrome b [Sphingomicrobium lutaoense]|uniref:Cytochrome b561 n=1 Tax=Sphingomicrobium lutaoense TaxID=515949 RepID=A0A839Z2H2_9SPHN|nr:cytochrome b/b6 domain-containing protein [Sphingomicrobium lutaoense]MBB3764247.1 cytochrome b561 [Sphingomicrobium lutaoense]